MKNTRTYQKRSSTIKDIKREPQGDDEERLSHLIVRPIPLGGWPTNITINSCRGAPQETRGLSPTSRLPSLGFLHQGDRSPQHLALKATWLTFGRHRGRWETEIPPFKGTHKNLTCSRTPGRSSNLLGPWVRPNCLSWRVSQRGRRWLEVTLVMETLAAAILGSFFYPGRH